VARGVEVSLEELLHTLLCVVGADGIEPVYLPERSVNPVRRRLADVNKADLLLGFRAGVDLRTGLERLVRWRRQVLKCGGRQAYGGITSADSVA